MDSNSEVEEERLRVPVKLLANRKSDPKERRCGDVLSDSRVWVELYTCLAHRGRLKMGHHRNTVTLQ